MLQLRNYISRHGLPWVGMDRPNRQEFQAAFLRRAAYFLRQRAMANHNAPEPVCKAILLCQKTILEADTNMVSLISLFDGFVVGADRKTGPAELFCRMTEAEGNYQIRVEIHDLGNGQIIAGTEAVEIDVPNRLSNFNVIIPIPPIPFAHMGSYDFVVFANGSEIDRQKFNVQQRS